MALEQHNMRISKWYTIVQKPEFVLCNQVWKGRNICYPLTKHINSHIYSHGYITQSNNCNSYGVPYENLRITQLLKCTQTGYQRVIAIKNHIIFNVQLWEEFELAADFINLDAPLNSPVSNTQSNSYICGSEENIIITNKGNKGVEIKYHEKDEYPSLTSYKKSEPREQRKQKKKRGNENCNGNNINGGKKQGAVMQTENNNKKKIAITTMNTYII